LAPQQQAFLLGPAPGWPNAAAEPKVNSKMGLLDIFRKSSSDKSEKKVSPKELARLTRVVGNKLSQDYDRQEAIGVLSELGTADAVRALLKRFDFNMEPSITDQDEKDSAARGVIAAGELALPPLRDYCARAESITWPLKILRQIVEQEHFVDELLELLEQFDTEYLRNPEPKIQLIATLEEFPSEEVRVAVEPFMTDVNEHVRFTAVGTVFAMGNAAGIDALVEALAVEESLRVKNRIAGGIAQRSWQIPETLREKCASAIPDCFVMNGAVLARG
jgi:HEAT repeat protein